MQRVILIKFYSLCVFLSSKLLTVIYIICLSFLAKFYNFLSRTVISFSSLFLWIQISYQYFIFMSSFRRSHPYKICDLKTLKIIFFSQFCFRHMLRHRRRLILLHLCVLFFYIEIKLSFLFIHFYDCINCFYIKMIYEKYHYVSVI